ncbi:MAG TPA: 3-deoxy-D-manno-octulosonic acid transferase [Tepidisphaeraceae bacterium]|nr:3-deoxy-D-manno-octulosonic acid transferase [Tepidisphaeraceae bacterium]
MPNLYDLAYAAGLALASPYWLVRRSARQKVMLALRERMGRSLPPSSGGECILLHSVSVGEVNVLPALLAELRNRTPGLRFVISTTTQTGGDRARQLFSQQPDVTLIKFPLDFTSAVCRVLEKYQPRLVGLMELEVWPNFMKQCHRRGIPVMVANGRITPASFRKYRRASWFTRPMFARLALAAVQDETYAAMFRTLGTPQEKIHVTGTMKFDSATIADRIAGDEHLAAELALDPANEPIWVCGSTGPGEESIALDTYRQLKQSHPRLRLVIVPRHPQRFDEVAGLIESHGFQCIRRSNTARAPSDSQHAIVLGDTMGELRKFYSLATVVFVGRSLVDLGDRQHGSDMIEPAALGKPVIVGPFTKNFDMPMRLLKKNTAVYEILSAPELTAAVDRLLTHADQRTAIAGRAVETVREAKGASTRHAEMIAGLISGKISR